MTGAEPARLRVLTYNVHGQRDDVAALARVVHAADPDVVLIQEGPRRLRWRSRCADLARRCGLFYGAGGEPAGGNLLLTGLRVRVVRTGDRRFPLRRGHHLRGAAMAECEIAGHRFVAAGSHLSTDQDRRAEQAALLAPWLVGQPVPTLLGADLNEAPGNPVWQTLTAAGLADAAAGTPAADRPTFSVASPRHRIDGIFVTPGLTVRGYDLLDTPDARLASDHLPVLADLTLT